MVKDKSPVKLRRKKLSNGNASLYLDIYDNGNRKKEYLKLYLIPERTVQAKEKNRKTIELAQTIQAERIINLQSNKSTFFTHLRQDNKLLKLPFIAYMEEEIKKMESLRTGTYIRRYQSVAMWVRRYDCNTPLEKIDKSWIQGFLHFLSITPGKYGRLLCSNTRHEYLVYVANILNNAVREGVIPFNPTKSLMASDRPKKHDSRREYLTEEEILRLRETSSPDQYNSIRRAFLFACYCGLRYSDIQQLKWKHIRETKEGLVIDKKLQKTQNMLYLPLNKRAAEFLPERGKDNTYVFTLPKSMATTEAYIKVWSEFAGIQKHVTFHTSRHSFAVNILAHGGDIYTLSKLLGHKRVTTTQIYADVLGETKRKTVELLDDK